MKIAAFNVQRLGWDKVNKEDVRDNIIKIMSRYSVVLLVEVTDKTGGPKDECSKAMPLLLDRLNDYGDNKRNPYGMRCSEPQGPKGHKEKFVYFYRKKEVQEIRCYKYVGKAVITRRPFIGRLNCPNTVVQDLVLISVHTKPSNAVAELIALHGVVEVVRKELKTDNIMILGDFNADGPYLSKKKKEKEALRIFSAPYHWLIGDDVDTTTTKKKKSAYDRIVVYGERMLEAIVLDSAKAYNFEEELELTPKQTKSVSNHYPVEVEVEVKLKVKVELEEQMGKLELEVKPEVELEVKPEVEVELKVKPEVELEEQMGKLELELEVKPEVELEVKVKPEVELEVEPEVEPEVELEEQMGKLELELKAQRNRNPV